MVILLHGDNITASRNQLHSLKEAFVGETLTFDAKNLLPEQYTQALESQSLLDIKRLVVLENPLANKAFLSYLPNLLPNIDLVLWEGKKLTTDQVQTLAKNIKGFSSQEFKLDPVVFQFVESLRPKNQKEILTLLRKYLTIEDTEVAFAMIIRQFRLLILTKANAREGPSDWQALRPWQKSKLENQARQFSLPDLLAFYRSLLEMDFQNKAGLLPTDLKTSLELLLFKL